MSTRYQGGIKSNQTFEFTSKAPLDSRGTVNTIKDLDTIENVYDGLQTYCLEDEQMYVYTIENGWKPYGKYEAGTGLYIDSSINGQTIKAVSDVKIVYKDSIEFSDECGGPIWMYECQSYETDGDKSFGICQFDVIDDKDVAAFTYENTASTEIDIRKDKNDETPEYGYYQSLKDANKFMAFKKTCAFKMVFEFTNWQNKDANNVKKGMIAYQPPIYDDTNTLKEYGVLYVIVANNPLNQQTNQIYQPTYAFLDAYTKDDDIMLCWKGAVSSDIAYNTVRKYDSTMSRNREQITSMTIYTTITKLNLYRDTNIEDIRLLDYNVGEVVERPINQENYVTSPWTDTDKLKEEGYTQEFDDDCSSFCWQFGSDIYPLGKDANVNDYIPNWLVNSTYAREIPLYQTMRNKMCSVYPNPLTFVENEDRRLEYVTGNFDLYQQIRWYDAMNKDSRMYIQKDDPYPNVDAMAEFVREEKTLQPMYGVVVDPSTFIEKGEDIRLIYCVSSYDEALLDTINPYWINIRNIKFTDQSQKPIVINYTGTFRIVSTNGYSENVCIRIHSGSIEFDDDGNVISSTNAKYDEAEIVYLTPRQISNDAYRFEVYCDEGNNRFFICVKFLNDNENLSVYTIDERISNGVIWRRNFSDQINRFDESSVLNETDIFYIAHLPVYNPDYATLKLCPNYIEHYLKDIRMGGVEGASVIDTSSNIAIIPEFDDTYKCTQSGVPMTEGNQQVGNMSQGKFTRAELETKTYNELFTEIFFKETNPFITLGSATMTTTSYEVGTPITSSLFNASITKQIEYGYVDNGGEYVTATANYTLSDITTKSGASVQVAKPQNNKGTASASYQGDDVNLLTSWGNREYEEEGVKKTLTLSSSSVASIPLSATIQGYYTMYYATGSVGVNIKPSDDLASFSSDFFENATPTTIGVTKGSSITSTNETLGTVKLTIGEWKSGGLTNTAFVYIILPVGLKISSAFSRNEVSGAEEQLTFIQKTSRTNTKGKLSNYYAYNVWQIAKFLTPMSDGCYSFTTTPIRINVTTE